MAVWPPNLGPQPPWRPPRGCPPDPQEYDVWHVGSYASKMFWRGFIPFFGGFLQSKVDQPPTCAEDNQNLAAGMEGALAEFEKVLTDTSLELWVDMNRMLADVTAIGQAVTDLMVLPLRNRLMYLFAAVTALALLMVAVLLGI